MHTGPYLRNKGRFAESYQACILRFQGYVFHMREAETEVQTRTHSL